MAGALGPAGSGAASSRTRISLIYTTGLVLGSAVLALCLATLGQVLEVLGTGRAVSVVIAIASVLVLLQLLGLRPLQSRWQVPEEWRRLMSMDLLAAFYGFLLGLGLFTAVVLSAFWMLIGLSLLAHPIAVLISWEVYALIRGLGFILASGTTKVMSPSPALKQTVVGLSALLSVIALLPHYL